MSELEHAVDVNFFALKSQYNNCICSACHNGATVLKLQLPTTLYEPPEYKRLKTQYREYWLCGNCLNKLRKAIRESWGGNE